MESFGHIPFDAASKGPVVHLSRAVYEGIERRRNEAAAVAIREQRVAFAAYNNITDFYINP